jgi:hypothetical protein
VTDETKNEAVVEVKEEKVSEHVKKSDVIVPEIKPPQMITVGEIERFCTVLLGIVKQLEMEHSRKMEMLLEAENPVPFRPTVYTAADRRYLRRQINRIRVEISKLGTAYMAFMRALKKAADKQKEATVSIPK